MNTLRNPADVHAPLAGYSHEIEVPAPARWLALSGQVGRTLDRHVPEDPAAQLDLALDNVLRNLRAAGLDVPDLVKLTLYLLDPIDPTRRREIFTARLGDHAPCMTLVYVVALAAPIYKVEVDAWAAR
jgi:2-iminobutanoate/2-iminopropanoate deaminase